MELHPSPTEIVVHLKSAEAFDDRFGRRLDSVGGRRAGLDVTLSLDRPGAGRLADDIAAAYPDPRGISISVTKLAAAGHDPVALGYALNVPFSTRFFINPTTATTVRSELQTGLRNWARRVDLGPYLAARAEASAPEDQPASTLGMR